MSKSERREKEKKRGCVSEGKEFLHEEGVKETDRQTDRKGKQGMKTRTTLKSSSESLPRCLRPFGAGEITPFPIARIGCSQGR